MHKSALRLLFDDYESSYRTLLLKANTPTMTVYSLRCLCGGIYTTVNGLNPNYMKNVFKKSDTSRSKQTQNQSNLIVVPPNYYEFGTKTLAFLG